MTNSHTATCVICNSNEFSFLTAKDHQIDADAIFMYGLCNYCGCLQCLEIPNDLSTFYPKNYYSHTTPKPSSGLKRIRRKFKRTFTINHPKWLECIAKRWEEDYAIFWVYRRAGLKKSDKILDVGSGAGAHVLHLIESGFNNALGIDPFIASDIQIRKNIISKRASIFDISGDYDVITFHHSLEHMQQQEEVLRKAKDLLRDDGWILVRIPTVTSEAFEKYKENWCALDAPRHLYLHSHKSIKMLAEKVGLKVIDLWCDSTKGQFIFSEEYKRGIKLTDSNSYATNPNRSIFSKREIQNFKKEAIRVNKEKRGDFLCIILKKTFPL